PKVAARAPPPFVRQTVGPAAGGAVAAAVVDHLALLGPTVRRTAVETPCPPLPRLATESCPHGAGRCGPEACGPQACPPPAFVPTAGPCLVCDGGDAGAPARPRGSDGIANLTAGDTVARFRAADDGPDADEVRLVASNCTCVFAPRFGAVREVVRPFEDAAPQGPRGIALDTHVGQETRLQPVARNTQNLGPESARKALLGIAVADRRGPLAVDQGAGPHEDRGTAGPAVRLQADEPGFGRSSLPPLTQIGFDVPMAWTRIQAANVLVGGQAAKSVAMDMGTATLRFEAPGRAQLTICKRAGTDTARSGEELDFTIFLLNSGDRPLTDLVVVDALPARLTLVPESAASSLPAAFSTEKGDDGAVVLKWTLDATLQPGESGFVRFRTLVQ
ncbi:MAG: hypothetical protein ACK6CT_09385, partial [Planctomycetia bacterium]